jgi:hypothetical protein
MDGGRFSITPEQHAQLSQCLRHDTKPYMRERCAAVLKVAAGQALKEVALYGLLRQHSPDTIHDWCVLFQQEGIQGLRIRPGRGRKPAFSPSAPRGASTRTSARARAPVA